MRIDLNFVANEFTTFLARHNFVAIPAISQAKQYGYEEALFRSDGFDLKLSNVRSDIGVSVRSLDSSADWYEATCVTTMISGEPVQILDEHTLPTLISRMDTGYEGLVEFFSPEGITLRDKFLLWSEERYWQGVRAGQAVKAEEAIAVKCWWKFS